jgi:hypothetical protein
MPVHFQVLPELLNMYLWSIPGLMMKAGLGSGYDAWQERTLRALEEKKAKKIQEEAAPGIKASSEPDPSSDADTDEEAGIVAKLSRHPSLQPQVSLKTSNSLRRGVGNTWAKTMQSEADVQVDVAIVVQSDYAVTGK